MATAVSNAAPNIPQAAPAPPAGAYPTDEDILGIYDETAVAPREDSFRDTDTDQPSANFSFGRVRPHDANDFVAEASAPASPTSQNAPTDRGATQTTPLPEWLEQVSAAAPNAAPELANLWERATALDTFDRAFYGADPSAQQQLITQLYTDDPSAFRAMVSAAAQLLDGSARADFSGRRTTQLHSDSVAQLQAPDSSGDRPGALPRRTPIPRGTVPPVGAHNPQAPQPNTRGELSYSPAASRADANGRDGGATQIAAPPFNAAAYAQFEQSTNDAVVTDVSRAIDRALDRALPDGIADGARRRIAGDMLAEVHTALRGDRQLASQVAGMLRSGDASGSHAPRFDNATRDAIARLIATRARGVVPEAARRVVGEWTGSVLSAHRERSARQQASAARVDVVGSQSQAPVARRAVKSSDINYRATTDEDILSW